MNRRFFRCGAQRGQVMPMTVVFIVAVILAIWVLYDSGQVMTEKIRLQNTADNVAYSSATLVARDLNFTAYTNRAMVANQVAIAQMVGLSSWMAMMNQFGHNVDAIGDVAQWFVPFGPIIKEVTQEIENAIAEVADVVDAFVEVVIPINEATIDGLSWGQFAYHQASLLALADFSRDIALQNDPDVLPFLGVSGYSGMEPATFFTEWSGQIGEQNELHPVSDSSDDAQLELKRYREFEAVVNESRDPFSKRRSYNWPGQPVHPWGGMVPLSVKWETRKYGGSDLFREVGDDEKYKWSWAAMDTSSMWFSFWKCGFSLPPCKWSGYDELIPLAWGAAHALRDDATSDYFEYGHSRRDRRFWGNGGWRNEIGANMVADSAFAGSLSGAMSGYSPFLNHAEHKVADIKGLREFYDFRADGAIDSGPAVIAFYSKDKSKISSQRTIIEGDGTGTVAEELDTESEGALVSDSISAIAKAEPYFARPTDLVGWKRADAKYEHGNLYNPFWQPRLIDLSDAEKGVASVAAGIGIGSGP